MQIPPCISCKAAGARPGWQRLQSACAAGPGFGERLAMLPEGSCVITGAYALPLQPDFWTDPGTVRAKSAE